MIETILAFKFQLLLGILPGLVWLFFFLQEDPDREPAKMIAAVFLTGGTFAVLTLLIQIPLHEMLVASGIFTLNPISITIMAALEELFKFLAAYAVIHHSKSFDVPTDAMIYMITAALGFATLENIGAITLRPGFTGNIDAALEAATFRFAGATLLHALGAGIIGYHWAKGIIGGGIGRKILWGLVLATVLHTVFNIFILTYGKLLYGVIVVLIGGIFVLKDFSILNKFKINIRG